MTNPNLTQKVIDRRANCRIPSAVALVACFGAVASIPMSIRQRDWKIWVLPLLAAGTFGVAGADKEPTEATLYRILGWGAQAGLAGVMLHRNKEDALEAKEAAV